MVAAVNVEWIGTTLSRSERRVDPNHAVPRRDAGGILRARLHESIARAAAARRRRELTARAAAAVS